MKPKLNQQQIEEAMRLRERGWSFERISRKLGVASKTIAWHALKLGVESPKGQNAIRAVPIQPVIHVCKNGRLIRRFTADEDAKLLTLEREGHSVNKIAISLKRTHNTVFGRLRTLARYQEITEAAQ